MRGGCHINDLLPVAISMDSGRLSSVRSRCADEIVTGAATQLGAPLVDNVVVVVDVFVTAAAAEVALVFGAFFDLVTAARILPSVLLVLVLLFLPLLLPLLLPLTLLTFRLLPRLVLLKLLRFQLPVLSSISASDRGELDILSLRSRARRMGMEAAMMVMALSATPQMTSWTVLPRMLVGVHDNVSLGRRNVKTYLDPSW
jgi:hypothetical protein